MPIEIRLAGEDSKAAIRSLLDDYLTELSEYGEVDTAYPYFESYWNEDEGRWPYLFFAESELIGFAFVNTVSPSGRGTDFSMAEFFVRPTARGRGHGVAAAKEIILKFNGQWELSIMQHNAPARVFWPKVISKIEGRDAECFDEEGERIHRFFV